MENNYWIVDDWLIFKPKFNEELTDYYVIINQYKKIMFSDYNNPLISIETNNQYTDEYQTDTVFNIFNIFNKKMDLSNNLNLTHLTFGDDFNQEIIIPFNIKSLNI